MSNGRKSIRKFRKLCLCRQWRSLQYLTHFLECHVTMVFGIHTGFSIYQDVILVVQFTSISTFTKAVSLGPAVFPLYVWRVECAATTALVERVTLGRVTTPLVRSGFGCGRGGASSVRLRGGGVRGGGRGAGFSSPSFVPAREKLGWYNWEYEGNCKKVCTSHHTYGADLYNFCSQLQKAGSPDFFFSRVWRQLDAFFRLVPQICRSSVSAWML